MISIAIDGPGGAGKSTLARRLAKELGYLYVDTGALYRAIGLYALRAGCPTKDADAVQALLPQIRLELRYVDGVQTVWLNGEDVSSAIRAEEVSMAASNVAAHPAVRAFLLQLQRDMAAAHNVLMDGRDIGTVVLPDATLKIYLTAPAEVRAARRLAQLAEKGETHTLEEILADINRRDWQDMHREITPLRQAPDAVLVDTGSLDLEESFQTLLQLIRKKVN